MKLVRWLAWLSINLVLLGCAALPLYAQRIPWVLPWNDASPGVADLSSLNPAIGTNRVAVDAAGHFRANDQRVRFLGMNFAADAPFMPTNYADAVAGRLAKFGVNAVRFHHMDASWAYNGGLLAYTSASSTNFNSVNLDRLHFVESRLKAHGIYADINLLVMQLNVPSAKNTERFVGAMRRMGIDAAKMRIVVNRYVKKGWDIAPEDVERSLGLKISWLIPNDFKNAIASINFGEPVVIRAPKSDMSASLLKLAGTLVSTPQSVAA